MLSQRRSRPLARPRQIAMYLAKKMTTRSLPEIGRRFANRDHTTVIHAVKTITRLSEQDDEMKKNINQISKDKFLDFLFGFAKHFLHNKNPNTSRMQIRFRIDSALLKYL